MKNTDQPTPFLAFRRFNDPELQHLCRLRARIGTRASDFFSGDGLPDRLVRALAARRALPIKEVFESFEFFERVRRRMRAPHLADLCCGHGLTGMLFAIFSRQVEHVTLVDRRRPSSHSLIFEACVEVAPWIKDRVHYLEKPISEAVSELPQGTSVIAVHACGKRTDACMEIGIQLQGKLAVMPCCYFGMGQQIPQAVVEGIGRELATDVHRSYALERAGYKVHWSAIPAAITPKRRILIGLPGKKAPAILTS
ncbi:MAG: hypothetical protein JRH20_14245 [Deltaproteobacteria bacterium]|nr:hypothetical protein [Deltaproteobacteria bacterium]